MGRLRRVAHDALTSPRAAQIIEITQACLAGLGTHHVHDAGNAVLDAKQGLWAAHVRAYPARRDQQQALRVARMTRGEASHQHRWLLIASYGHISHLATRPCSELTPEGPIAIIDDVEAAQRRRGRMASAHAPMAPMTDDLPPLAPPFSQEDERYMRRALQLAEHARDAENEVPVGAVLVQNGEIIGLGWNRNITLNDPSAHAEIMALRAAGEKLSNYRMPGATLYVTLEPCAMCSMALVHARISRVVYAATDPKTGAAGSVFDTLISDRHNHRVTVEGGLLAKESSTMLREFFRARR